MGRTRKQAIIEALKELGRLMLFAMLSVFVTWATEQLSGLEPTSTYYVVGTLILRFIDKFIHENEETNINGLAPF